MTQKERGLSFERCLFTGFYNGNLLCTLYSYQNTPQAIPQQAALIRNIGAASVRLKVFDKLVSHINFHSDRVASDVLLVAF